MEKKKKRKRNEVIKKTSSGYYEKGDKKFVSVTTLLDLLDKPGLRYFYGTHGTERATQIVRRAAGIGHDLHGVVEGYFKTGKLPEKLNGDIEICGRNFTKFVERFKPKAIFNEQVVYDEKYGIAGTLDAYLEIEGKNIILDWKTSNSFYETHLIQLNAYAFMLQEMVHRGEVSCPLPDECWVVKLPKEEDVNLEKDIVRFAPKGFMWDMFLNLKVIYDGLKETKELMKKVRGK